MFFKLFFVCRRLCYDVSDNVTPRQRLARLFLTRREMRAAPSIRIESMIHRLTSNRSMNHRFVADSDRVRPRAPHWPMEASPMAASRRSWVVQERKRILLYASQCFKNSFEWRLACMFPGHGPQPQKMQQQQIEKCTLSPRVCAESEACRKRLPRTAARLVASPTSSRKPARAWPPRL